MGLLGEVREASAAAKKRCRIDEIKEELGDEGDELQEAFDDENVTTLAIYEVLHKRGLKVGEHAIRRHRKQVCVCYR